MYKLKEYKLKEHQERYTKFDEPMEDKTLNSEEMTMSSKYLTILQVQMKRLKI